MIFIPYCRKNDKMIRGSNHGNASDAVSKIISGTCYGEHATEIVQLFREMTQSYHRGDSGDKDARGLSERIYPLIPTAHKVSSVGMFSVYKINVSGKTYRYTWRELMAKGSYNHVYFGELVDESETVTPAVVKVTLQPHKDLRVYLMENVLHAFLYNIPNISDIIVPIRYPFKVRQNGYPNYKLGTVMDDPGKGHLGDWIDDKLEDDRQMFAIMTQVAWMVYRVQKELKMEHRDLKCDNIMISQNADMVQHIRVPENDLDYTIPSLNLRCMFIDFGMTRLEYGDEYLACDCMHRRTRFNPCQDLQHFCCTLYEDYADTLKEHAPRFYRWLKATCEPLYTIINKKWKDYDTSSASKQQERMGRIVNCQTIPTFKPSNMLQLLYNTSNF